MKRKTSNVLCVLLALVMAVGLLPTAALAETGDVPIDAAHFPDANFRAVVSEFDTDGDGALSAAEIWEVWKIDCAGKDIASLQGIEYFTEVFYLDCSYNQLTELDVRSNPDLGYLYCSDNQLTELDVRSNPDLGYLYCSDNQLTELDVRSNPDLGYLYCSYNLLTELDVRSNPALTKLDCSNNQLTELDARQNAALEYLVCSTNQLTELDVRQNPALKTLSCSLNFLTELDVRSNPALEYLDCAFNRLPALDVSENPALTVLWCLHNYLEELDVRQNPALEEFNCSFNQLTALDVSGNPALTALNCSYNQLKELDVRKNPALTELDCGINQLKELDVRQNPALKVLSCMYNELTALDVHNNAALELLECYGNALTTLDVREVPVLLDVVMHGERTVNDSVVRYADRADVIRFKMDDGVTLLPEEANPTPASPQPTTRPDGTKPAETKTKPDDSKPAEPTTKPDDTKPIQNPFADVQISDYFYDPVLWALTHEPQITNGMAENTFGPGETCTRGQVVTFLWRAMGCEEPKSAINPFHDVTKDDYFYKAVLWAVEKGITDGTSDTTFSPNDPCTRAHVVTFLWRAENRPAAGSRNPFADVAAGEYYTDAVLWAVSKGITDGTSDTTFSPADPCTRGQIVTFLYRDMK